MGAAKIKGPSWGCEESILRHMTGFPIFKISTSKRESHISGLPGLSLKPAALKPYISKTLLGLNSSFWRISGEFVKNRPRLHMVTSQSG